MNHKFGALMAKSCLQCAAFLTYGERCDLPIENRTHCTHMLLICFYYEVFEKVSKLRERNI